jgi:hypothetical protein
MKTRMALALAAVAVASVACSKVSAGQQAVEVDSWGSPTVSGCVKEETQVGTITVDLYRYPARQISWDATNESNAERGPYDVLSKDQAYMKIPLTIQMDLTTDCDKLKQFHRDYGTKYSGWLTDDGQVSQGWKDLLTYVISQPAEIALTAISRGYTYQEIWNEESVRIKYQDELKSQLPKESARRTGGTEYFTNFQVNVLKPYPASDAVRGAKEGEISAAAEAKKAEIAATADANARQKAADANRLAADAERAQAESEARKKAAEIAGYGTGPAAVEAWLRDTCIHTSGCQMYNPSPIIAGAR